MKYKAVLFDMDGTILDTLEDLGDALNYALSETGFPKCSYMETRDYIGDGVPVLVARGIAGKHIPAASELPCEKAVYDKALSLFKEYYSVHCNDKTRPFPGISDLIADIKKAGCKTAVVSNKHNDAVIYLADLYFPGLFDAVSGNLPGMRTKPAPDLPERIISILGIPKEEMIYIGDTEIDIKTAENAGIKAVLVDWGNRDKDYLYSMGAENVVSDVSELRALLEL